MGAAAGRGSRLLGFGRRAPKLTATPSALPADVAGAAQELRSHLQRSNQSRIVDETPARSLINLASSIKKAPDEAEIPTSVFKLIARTLDNIPNYKGELSPENLQLVFRAVASRESKVDLATRLYLDLYRHTKISAADKLENGLYYYKLLRKNGLVSESTKMLGALLRESSDAVTDEYITKLLDVASEVRPDGPSFVGIIEAWNSSAPATGILTRAIEMISAVGGPEDLNRLAVYLYFENPHFSISEDVAIVLLDAFLQLPQQTSRTHLSATAGAENGGEKVLQICLARMDSKTSLETLELLLMSCIHFQEPVPVGNNVERHIRQSWSVTADYTKETWDVLCQWSVYKAANPLDSLRHEILTEMPSEYVDQSTLHGVLTAASDKAQCNEVQVKELVGYFENDLGITPDAGSTAILIRRALLALEVDRARQLFMSSNADWNADDNKYVGELSDLLVALCRTPSIPRQAVVDTYQRVSIFARPLAYEAQTSLLKMFLDESGGESTPAGLFLIDQFGEVPGLKFEDYREIYNLFFNHIMASTDDTKAWNLFGILNCTVKLPYESYYPLQKKFCDLGRPDVAHIMFRNLRTRVKAAEGIRPPGPEMYAMLLAEYAKWRFEEGIHELDTYFRMDLNNEMTPSIMNRILAAYSALDDSHKIASLWSEALSLPRGGVHGPNNETMSIMLRYFGSALGLEAVDDLWSEMASRFGLLPTEDNLKQYVIANCYNGYYMRALEIVKAAPDAYNIRISRDILQALYNWTLIPQRKAYVREFALEMHTDEWKQLEATPGALKEVVLPSIDSRGEYDEASLRFEAIRELESSESSALVAKPLDD